MTLSLLSHPVCLAEYELLPIHVTDFAAEKEHMCEQGKQQQKTKQKIPRMFKIYGLGFPKFASK